MMSLFRASDGNRDRDPMTVSTAKVSERLKRLAANPWALSFCGFFVTALLIQADGSAFL